MIAYTYSIEWQKRGLPHAHILIWLENKIQPRYIDNYISAEIPNPNIDQLLHNIVVQQMIHGPCGHLNPNSPCMQNNSCTKKYPRNLIRDTMTSEDGYPLYKRRSPNDGGYTTTKRISNRQEVVIDNSWVVPYSPILCRVFKDHINVEICNSVKAIQYICKYINKGMYLFYIHMYNTKISYAIFIKVRIERSSTYKLIVLTTITTFIMKLKFIKMVAT